MSASSGVDVPAPPADPSLIAALMSAEPALVLEAVRRAVLLVAADVDDDGTLVARTGAAPDRPPLVWAFTDLEALTAWDLRPAPGALAVAGSDLVRGTAAVVLNPAGPGALVLAAGDGLPGSPSGPDLTATQPAGELVPVAPDRAAARRRARSAFDGGLAAARGGDLPAAIRLLEEALDACGELGDRLHGAHVGRALAECHAQRGDHRHAGVLRQHAAEVFDALGEGELATATRRRGRAWHDDGR